MTTFITSLVTLFTILLLTLTCMASISSFISDRDNPFSIKTSKLLKISIYLPIINIVVGFFIILIRLVMDIKENLDEFDNKKY
nr:MAG TPA: hypothetical protein [Caudoviricetes sp.]